MEEYKEIEIDKIRAIENIRVKNESLHELMDSIKQNGLQQPIGVWKSNGEYVLLFGFRRLESCKKLGWKKIPALVKDEISKTEHLIINAIENLQRKDITPYELGRIATYLMEMGLTRNEVSARLGLTKNRLTSALITYGKIPDKWKKEISFYENNRKNTGISVTLANRIMHLKRDGITDEETEKLFEIAKFNEFSVEDVNLITNLIKNGMKTDDAIENFRDYGTTRIGFFYKQEEMKKLQESTGLPKGQILKDIINGKLPQKLIRVR